MMSNWQIYVRGSDMQDTFKRSWR